MSTVLNTDNCALSKFHQSTKRLTDRAVERVQRLRAETMERAKEGRARTVEDKRHASMLAIEGNSVGETFEELKEVGEKNEQLKEKKEENIEEKEKDDKVNEGQECDAGKKKNEKMRKRGATRSRKRIKSENMRSLNPSTSIGVITMSFPKRSSDSF
ncbi:uncharacterized protein LOC131944183 isoform X1 [Physella acuta]|uniref:uncharacterized protein LOC131944183 isoform X1 n=1 Tax=Physella acuta TaxID=109671 RepID=UPI0027DBD26A|nr:uncharacterized protein LOC131944183 isoform X1 [Physella acuta]